jgi:hypothetical protein
MERYAIITAIVRWLEEGRVSEDSSYSKIHIFALRLIIFEGVQPDFLQTSR